MKKLLVLLLTLSCSAAFALPMYNPTEASLMTRGVYCEGPCDPDCCSFFSLSSYNLRLGFTGFYTKDRKLKLADDVGFNGTVQQTQINANAGYIALNWCNWVDVFATLGAADLRMDNVNNLLFLSNDQPNSGQTETIRTDTSFAWSIGGRGTLWQCGALGFGLSGQYYSSKMNIDNYSATFFDNGELWDFSQWNVGLGASWRINISDCTSALLPYIGVVWSGASLTSGNLTFTDVDDNTVILRDLENDQLWGFVVGVTLLGCEKVNLTAEGHFCDYKSFAINGSIRF